MKRTRVSVVAVGAAMALTATVMTSAPASSAPVGTIRSGAGAAAPALDSVASFAALGKRRTKVTAKASTRKVVVLQKARITGKVNGPNKRKVALQLKNAYGWANVDKDKSNKKGKYSLKVPTMWYGTKKMRVLAPPTRRFQADKNKVTVKVTEGYVPLGKNKSWTRLLSGYQTRYNPCQTVKYAVNPSMLPPDGIAVLNEAIFRIELATGLRYKYSGATKAIPFRTTNGKEEDKKANLSVAWSTAETDASTLGGGVVARGGISRGLLTSRNRTFVSKKTGLLMDAGFVYADRGFLNGASMGAVHMHELVHAAGMGHADRDQLQIMYPFIDPAKPALFGAGDLTGLKKHGRDAGCLQARSARPVPGSGELLTPVNLP